MLRSFTLQPLSLVIGVAFSGLVLLSMSQAPPPNARAFNVQYGPDPRDMVQIRYPVPYTVPPGKLLVVTGVGGTAFNGLDGLRVDGQMELQILQDHTGNPSSIVPVPLGFTIPAGSVVDAPWDGGRIWGYLAPQ